MKTLMAKLQATYPNSNKRIVVGFSADKDIYQCSQTILSIVKEPSRIHLVEAVNLRAAKIQKILDAVRLRGDEALLEYTTAFDKVSLEYIQVSSQEFVLKLLWGQIFELIRPKHMLFR